MTEDALKNRIHKLEKELEGKENETNENLDRIEELEENVMRLDALIPEENNKKKTKKQQAFDSKLAIELDEKDKQIRDLKNRMGFLRKDKVQLQQEIKKLKIIYGESSVIRMEDIRNKSPLNTLVKELQDKLNNQRALINKLRSKLVDNDKINKKLNSKNEEIEDLKKKMDTLQKAENAASFEPTETPSEDINTALKENLQNKLNKAKIQIESLQEQLKKYETNKPTERGKSQKKIEENLLMQKEMANFLQKQLETKEGEIKTIKNEAVQIKRRYRQLENQLKLKDQKLNESQVQLDKYSVQKEIQPQKEDPHITIRLKEFKSIIDSLKKENIEQRIEISHLRKKV